jgi:hypothetical protein
MIDVAKVVSQATKQLKGRSQMSLRYLTSMDGSAIVIAFALLATVPVTGQTWTLSRTADGQPDLQGVWDFRTITPLERPVALGTKEFFTDEEAAMKGTKIDARIVMRSIQRLVV